MQGQIFSSLLFLGLYCLTEPLKHLCIYLRWDKKLILYYEGQISNGLKNNKQ